MAIISAGSPGTKCIMEKVIMDTPSKIKTINPILLMI
jgi:hypothetical protein